MRRLLPLVLAALAVGAMPVEDPIEIELTKLADYDYRPGMDLPASVADLDGIRVVFDAYMHNETDDDTKTFLVVGDACMCAGTPLVNHFVEITLDSGRTGYRPGQITFEGRLSVSEKTDDLGLVESLYRLDGNFF
ncbi:MAG: hypothetical protein WD226_09250 [Planctomycetota bacterium]